MNATEEEEESTGSDELDLGGDDFGGDFGGEDLPSPEDLGGEEEIESEPLDIPEAPEESFYTGTGDLLNEANDLPSFDQLGVSFNNVK